MGLVGKFFHLIVVSLLLTGIFDVFYNYPYNECKMTYMWEYPEYAKIPLQKNVSTAFPNYELYLYGEGGYMKFVTQSFNLTGIPVLYIPGNGGSFKQGRSIGSVLLRKSENVEFEPHFNVFTVNLNEEIVALYGGTLRSQVRFISHCIKRILSLYNTYDSAKQSQPSSIVLIGHSMGGIVARGLFLDNNFDNSTVNTILTFASPQIGPVINFDHKIASFYEDVNLYWTKNEKKFQKYSVLSVSGGSRDFQVNTALSKLPIVSNNSISTVATHVPRTFVSPDHQSSVWCNQLVLATARALFDMVDPNTSQISNDHNLRSKVLQYHFVHHPGYSSFSYRTKSNALNLVAKKNRLVIDSQFWSKKIFDMKNPEYVVIDLSKFSTNQNVMLIAITNSVQNRWVFACNTLQDTSAIDMSSNAYKTQSYRILKQKVNKLLEEGHSMIIFSVKPSDILKINIAEENTFITNVTVPNMFSHLFMEGKLYNLSLIPDQFYHKINLIGFQSIFHAFYLAFSFKSDFTLLEYEAPNEVGMAYKTGNNISLSLSATFWQKNKHNFHPSVNVISVENTKNLSLTIKSDSVKVLGQIIRYFGISILPMIVINILFAYSHQIYMLLKGKSCLNMAQSHNISAKPYKVQPFVSLIKFFLTYESFNQVWYKYNLTKPDFVFLEEKAKVWFAFAPFCTFLFAYEITQLLFYLVFALLKLLSIFFNKLNINLNIKVIISVYTITSATLLYSNPSYIFANCFTVSLIQTCCLYIKNYNYVKEKDAKFTSFHQDEFNVNLTLTHLWMFLLVFHIPAIIGGIKGYKVEYDNVGLCVFTSIIMLIQMYKKNSSVQNSKLSFLQWLFLPTIVICSLFSFTSLYRIPYFVLSFFTMHILMLLM